jgi:hypothetical protein
MCQVELCARRARRVGLGLGLEEACRLEGVLAGKVGLILRGRGMSKIEVNMFLCFIGFVVLVGELTAVCP